MRRGFKAEAERLAQQARSQIGLDERAPLDIDALAKQLGLQLVSADELVPLDALEKLKEIQDNAFSAATFELPDGRKYAVFNPCSTWERTRSDLAHECSHLLLRHDVREIQTLAGHPFLTCDPAQEEEANWLAGCLLLPRQLLLEAALAGTSPEDLAKTCEVSVDMARFRLNTSGVLLQARRRKPRK